MTRQEYLRVGKQSRLGTKILIAQIIFIIILYIIILI